MRTSIIFLVFFLNNFIVNAQRLDFALAAKKEVAPSVSIDKFYGKKFKVGIGLRANAYFSKTKTLQTAPYQLTSGKPSLIGFFTPYKTDKLDSLDLSSVSVFSLNAKLSLEYTFKKSGLGFNIDLFGLTFGNKKEGNFRASESKTINNTVQTGKPTPYNLLMVSDSDIGNLNSELYFRKNLNAKKDLRLGLSFQFIEYTTSKKLTFDNDRFRLKTLMPFIAYNIEI